jgi:site-specific recombinase XerD
MFYLFSKKLNISECLKRYFIRIRADCSLAVRSVEKYEVVGKRWLDLMGDGSVKKINDEYIVRLKQKLNELNASPAYKNHFLVLNRNLLRYMEEVEQEKIWDYRKIKKFKIPIKEVEYLPKEDLVKLANYPKEHNVTGLRMRAAIWTLISTGCRASELLNLKISDIDLQNGIAQIRTKGNKPHQIIFNKQSLDAIGKYLEKRTDNEDWLFVAATPNPKQWSISDLERSLRAIGKKLGFKKNIRPHLIRKSSATLLFKNGTPLGVVQAFLNHSSPQVTCRFYLGNANFEELKLNHDRVMGFDDC